MVIFLFIVIPSTDDPRSVPASNYLRLFVQKKDLPKLRELLEERGYKDVPKDDTSERNFVLGDGKYEIDVHVVRIDDEGVGIYNEEENDHYPAESLTGTGLINGQVVRCISPEWTVKFHTRYRLTETDRHDVKLLCEKFNFTLPDDHQK